MSFSNSYSTPGARCPRCNNWGCTSRGCMEALADHLRVENAALVREVRELKRLVGQMAREKRVGVQPKWVKRQRPTAPTAPQRRHHIPMQEGRWR